MPLDQGRKPLGVTDGLLRCQAALAHRPVARGEEGHDFFNADTFSRSDSERHILDDITGRGLGRALRSDACRLPEELGPGGLRDGYLGLVCTDQQGYPLLTDRLAGEGFQMVAA